MKTVSRLERKKAATREKIFQTAMELFLRQGFDETTVDQIVEQADVAKGTFFNYFPTKDAILFYLGQQRVLMLSEVLQDELSKVTGAGEKILSCLRVYARANEENREVTALVIRQVFRKTWGEMDPEKESIQAFKQLFAEIIRAGQGYGEFRADEDAGRVADILVGLYFFTLLQWLDREFTTSLGEELVTRAALVLEGLKHQV